MGRHVKNVQLPGETATIPAVSTTNRPAGKNGQLIFNSTTATFQAYIGASWHNVSTAAGEKTLVIDKFQGDGSTKVFGGGSGIDIDGSTVASFSTSFDEATDVLVFIGGIAQIPTTNYNISGNQIIFGSPPPANDGTTNGHVITVVQNLQKLGE